MTTVIKWAALAAVCLLLTGCGMLSPEQQQHALQVVDQMVAQGSITHAQGQAMRESILSTGSIWEHVIDIGAGAALAFLGVRANRGKPTQKVGLAADKVIGGAK
ncbi:MAG: hypothetical protein HRU13_13550 [Phycisphaerales bacterium]|nr:hypothetical protein [Phycisphaerales bacterium]